MCCDVGGLFESGGAAAVRGRRRDAHVCAGTRTCHPSRWTSFHGPWRVQRIADCRWEATATTVSVVDAEGPAGQTLLAGAGSRIAGVRQRSSIVTGACVMAFCVGQASKYRLAAAAAGVCVRACVCVCVCACVCVCVCLCVSCARAHTHAHTITAAAFENRHDNISCHPHSAARKARARLVAAAQRGTCAGVTLCARARTACTL